VAETLKDKLAKIEQGENLILKLFKEWMDANSSMYISDFFRIGVAKRTLALSQGFRMHIEARNFTCAAALLRMQVDTALRVYAAFLVPSAEKYAKAVFDGERVDLMKDRHGRRLKDGYLAKKLSEHHPWVERVYRDTCNFVHFTSRHIFTSIASLNDDEGLVYFQVSAKDPSRAESDYFEVVDAFYASMKLTVSLTRAWHDAKPPKVAEAPSAEGVLA
jgi:hypothetical protein